MAFIDDDLVVKFADGKLYFEHPGDRAEVLLANFGKEDGKDLPETELRAQLWDMLLKVENLKRKDGTEVTVEDLKAQRHSKSFFRAILKLFLVEVSSHAVGGYTSSGNVETPAS